ncbi:uncharacterized protein LOC110393468 [Numida meleagris]|uniref:uncharacterized protein LOC110393468 n=1 Tax=Numida meleagris TaxID=8996 RepID=UPI000B3E120C|nr:uncharacterized protein LOC110393468 [Numida meleagris]
MRCLCQTLLEMPPACRQTAPLPFSRPVTTRSSQTAAPVPRLSAPRGDKRRWARGSARSRVVPRDAPRWGRREGSAGTTPRPPRRPRVSRHGPLSEALPAASPLTSPHLTPPRSPGAEPRGPATYPQAAARRPHAARARRHRFPSAPPERAPRARHRARRRAAPPPLPKRRPLTRSRRGGGAAPEEPGSGGGRLRPGLWAPARRGSAQPVSPSRHPRPLGLLGAARWQLLLALLAASPGSVSFCAPGGSLRLLF